MITSVCTLVATLVHVIAVHLLSCNESLLSGTYMVVYSTTWE